MPYTFILDCENPSRPVYRLAGTALCERFGFEMKGTGFLAHWDGRNRPCRWRRCCANRSKQKSRSASHPSPPRPAIDTAELETILTPVSFNGGEPRRFFGLVQMLSDPTPLLGRAIAYERLVASKLIQEDEPLA